MCWAGAPWQLSTMKPHCAATWSMPSRAAPDRPILVDQFLEDAYEIDVDAIGDGERVVIGGVMQHIEEAGIHSGDSACVLPPYKISSYHLHTIQEYTEKLGYGAGRARADECPVRHQG
jgi:carbamoyl-phosphate synthase large subunit